MSPFGGDERVRTAGLLLARQALSQLSYTPMGLRWSLTRFARFSFEGSLHLQNYIVLSLRFLSSTGLFGSYTLERR